MTTPPPDDPEPTPAPEPPEPDPEPAPPVPPAAARRPRAPRVQLPPVPRDGPKWDPGAKVDVVVYLHDVARREYRLRAPDQLIQRTD